MSICSTFYNLAKIYWSELGSDVGKPAERSTEWSFAWTGNAVSFLPLTLIIAEIEAAS